MEPSGQLTPNLPRRRLALLRVPPVRPQPPDGDKRRHEVEALEPGELA
jgi:hypothetical protein